LLKIKHVIEITIILVWVASNSHLQSKFTIIRPKNYKKSLLCGLNSQTSAEKPPKNGGGTREKG
jgi:hypothetical protein